MRSHDRRPACPGLHRAIRMHRPVSIAPLRWTGNRAGVRPGTDNGAQRVSRFTRLIAHGWTQRPRQLSPCPVGSAGLPRSATRGSRLSVPHLSVCVPARTSHAVVSIDEQQANDDGRRLPVERRRLLPRLQWHRQWDSCDVDRCLQIGPSGDVPLVGDWDGIATTKVGTFRPSDGAFYLDYNGNEQWDGCGVDRCISMGLNGDIPLVGDWNGSGTSKVGTFRPTDGAFYLDFNGNGVWDGCGTDRCLQMGLSGDIPLIGRW